MYIRISGQSFLVQSIKFWTSIIILVCSKFLHCVHKSWKILKFHFFFFCRFVHNDYKKLSPGFLNYYWFTNRMQKCNAFMHNRNMRGIHSKLLFLHLCKFYPSCLGSPAFYIHPWLTSIYHCIHLSITHWNK